MIRGYFRLEPDKNNAQEKIAALIDAGAGSGSIFFEATGTRELNRLVNLLRKGDILVTAEAADICRTKEELANLIEKLGKKGAALRVLDEPWLDFNMRKRPADSLPEKTTGEALRDAKSAGRPKGPRREILQKLSLAFRMYHTAEHVSVSEICKTVKLNERTFYRHLERQQGQIIRRPKGRKPKNTERN